MQCLHSILQSTPTQMFTSHPDVLGTQHLSPGWLKLASGRCQSGPQIQLQCLALGLQLDLLQSF